MQFKLIILIKISHGTGKFASNNIFKLKRQLIWFFFCNTSQHNVHAITIIENLQLIVVTLLHPVE